MQLSKIATILVTLTLPVGGQNIEADLFSGRTVTGHPQVNDKPDSDRLHAFLGSPLARMYGEINPRRSLLLYDCKNGSIWCSDASWGFAQVFSNAVTNLKLGKPDDFAKAWYLSANDAHLGGTLDKWGGSSVKTAPFQLLAIVNRIDLGEWRGGKWVGAELRFVYGRLPIDGNVVKFNLIIEFVLPSLDWIAFKKLAGLWKIQSDITLKDEEVAVALQTTIKSSGFDRSQMVRIRTNEEAGGPWQFGEWHLTPTTTLSSGRLDRSDLIDELAEAYVLPALGSVAYWDYLQLWPDITNMPGNKRIYVAPKFLSPDSRAYSADEQTMDKHAQTLGTPPNFCATETTRNVLGLQQCSGCHSVETGTQFAHIPNRATTEDSVPSKFLAGSGPDPTLGDIYYGTKQIFSQDVFYDTYKLPAYSPVCSQKIAKQTTRKFYDLGRRRLFLAAVLDAPDKPQDYDVEALKIQQFGTDFSH